MRIKLLIIALVLVSNFVFSQENKIDLTPKGVYAEIEIAKQKEMIDLLIKPSTRLAAIDTVFNNISKYNPAVFYVMSQVLFVEGEKQNAVDWYLFAQISAMYDVNRSIDKSVKQNIGILETRFRPLFKTYISEHKQEYMQSIDKAVKLFKLIPQDYDIRWINLSGTGAVIASLEKDVDVNKKLTVIKDKWPAIKASTIKDFIDKNKK